MRLGRFSILLIVGLLTIHGMAQEKAPQMVYLEHSETLSFDEKRLPDAQILRGDVRFRHDSALMYCDSAYFFDKENSLHAFGHVHLIQGDSIEGFGDVLYYNGNTKMAKFRKRVRLIHNGNTTLKTREKLAVKVFMRTSAYDTAISNYLGHRAEDSTKNNFTLSLPFNQTLRYGDNPHQPSVLYGNFDSIFTQLQGKELSYTNILDLDAAASLIMNFRRPTVGILKHTNPCGVGQDDEDLVEAWKRAYQTDTQAPFGGVIVMNRPMTEALARIVGAIFTDVIIAPDYEPEARAILTKKKNCRIMRIDMDAWREFCKLPMMRTAPGGVMTMKRDDEAMGLDNLESKVVTKRVPTAEELEAMRFAWRVCKQVHSNAIVFTDKNGTLGIGAGQMSRVDSAKIAVWKAGQAGLDLKGSVIASDGLFPFADGLQTAIDAGATACIQPGGSIRDEEVIAAADAAGIAMVFTGARHFLH